VNIPRRSVPVLMVGLVLASGPRASAQAAAQEPFRPTLGQQGKASSHGIRKRESDCIWVQTQQPETSHRCQLVPKIGSHEAGAFRLRSANLLPFYTRYTRASLSAAASGLQATGVQLQTQSAGVPDRVESGDRLGAAVY
jgi:hypothetical protein